ncbi:tRNA pseudouridine(55) synthase TruB [Peptoniphilus catoniae]|uniref:tRNA pseudouridine(55) synthase TruB n=1 Tax=Peptoniphilus catoniae TaxID=1660341 RepID=UPI0010FD6166|nr:tRNA pseudouridine(55) synthase TruB [Peptoniphilus catoniae]
MQKKNYINGILIINKAQDLTSHDVVNFLRRKLNIKKVGHAGTLDPMATGVLVMCIGKATKISEYLMSNSKTYIADLSFGYETDTLDKTGEIIKRNNYIPDEESLEKCLKSFLGKTNQVPPMYSAIKYNGRKLYELARMGKTVELKERKIEIKSIEIEKKLSDKSYRLIIDCSSGTYIRSLVRDIAYSLNSLATLEGLVRTRSGRFAIEESLNLEDLDKLSLDEIKEKIISTDEALANFKSYSIPSFFYDKIINGVAFKAEADFRDNELVKLYCKNKFIGIANYYSNEEFTGFKMKKMLKGE